MKTREIAFLAITIFLSGCHKDNNIFTLPDYPEYVPSSVLVRLIPSYSIVNTFEFINSLELEVEVISSKVYLSELPVDSLEYIKNYLSARIYLNNDCSCDCYVNEQNKISIYPLLYFMNDTVNQNDWIKCMNNLLLTEQLDDGSRGYYINFHVPVGEEKEWIDLFNQYEFVETASYNYLFYIL